MNQANPAFIMTPMPSPPPENTPPPPTPRVAVEAFTRASVRTVFKDMLNLDMTDDEPLPLAQEAGGLIVGSVGFLGDVTGIVHLHTGVSFAKAITSRMVGIEETELEGDEIINDAIAELGNVVVGAVKSRLCDLGWSCTLTIPSVLRGHQLSVVNLADATRTVIAFRTGDQRLIVEMLVKNPPTEIKSQPLKILTVDDSKTVRLVVAKVLKRFDCVVLEAVNGADGLAVAAREKPDLILLDYTMPVLNGFETMTQLMADPALKAIPVVMLTAEGGRETMVKMAKLGVRDYLVKPFKEDVVIERVGRIVTLSPKTDATLSVAPLPAGSALPNKDF